MAAIRRGVAAELGDLANTQAVPEAGPFARPEGQGGRGRGGRGGS